jgi:hypothetical protein
MAGDRGRYDRDGCGPRPDESGRSGAPLPSRRRSGRPVCRTSPPRPRPPCRGREVVAAVEAPAGRCLRAMVQVRTGRREEDARRPERRGCRWRGWRRRRRVTRGRRWRGLGRTGPVGAVPAAAEDGNTRGDSLPDSLLAIVMLPRGTVRTKATVLPVDRGCSVERDPADAGDPLCWRRRWLSSSAGPSCGVPGRTSSLRRGVRRCGAHAHEGRRPEGRRWESGPAAW